MTEALDTLTISAPPEPWMPQPPPLSRQERLKALIAKKDKLRKLPGHCIRCGKPHEGRWKTCDNCRLYRVNYHKRKRWAPINLNECERMLTELGARVHQLERQVKSFKDFARNGYNRGYARGRLGRV